MKPLDQQIFDFIEDQEHYELINSNGIVISVPDQNLLEVEFTLVNMEDASLSVSFHCEPKGFVKALGIRNIRDINALSPGSLMETYYEGLAELICFVSIEYTYDMSFQKLGNRLVAENERGFKHNVPLFEKLETPDQFIAYTKRYYKLMECGEN